MGLEEVQMRNLEHRTNRTGWLRAAVLGSNDGLVSTASLMIGVAAASKSELLNSALSQIFCSWIFRNGNFEKFFVKIIF